MLFTTFEKYLKEKRGVLHVGAHTGEERDWYKVQGFTEVLWFEPSRQMCQKLKRNIEGYENQFAFNLGIHDSIKKTKLNVASNKGLSSSILPFGTHLKYRPDIVFVTQEDIKLMRMDDFLRENKISINRFNFLNLDVQGVELSVLRSFGDLIRRLDYIYTEVNTEELYRGGCLIGQIDSYLHRRGFERVETFMTNNNWGDAFYIKK